MSRVTQKGRVTFPAGMRSQLGLNRGDRIGFTLKDDVIQIVALRSRLLAGFGAVQPIHGLEDARLAREAFEQGVAAAALREG